MVGFTATLASFTKMAARRPSITQAAPKVVSKFAESQSTITLLGCTVDARKVPPLSITSVSSWQSLSDAHEIKFLLVIALRSHIFLHFYLIAQI